MSKEIVIDTLTVIPLALETSIGLSSLTGTGFVVEHKSSKYLITNWHMVTGRDPDTNKPLSSTGAADPLEILVWFHLAHQLGTWESHVERLIDKETGKKRWLEHPKGREVDVVAIPIATQSDREIYPLDRNLAKVDLLLSPSEPVSIIGFPMGISSSGKFPIWKTGHIASEIDFNYNKKPVFLVDAITKPGMSGAPVFAKRIDFIRTSKGPKMGGSAVRFLGIYAGRIRDHADVGMVWKPEVLDAILP